MHWRGNKKYQKLDLSWNLKKKKNLRSFKKQNYVQYYTPQIFIIQNSLIQENIY